MHRIDTPTAQKDKFGAGKNGFTAGNPQTGTPATDLDNDYFDMLQEELAGVVEATGVSLVKSRHNQLLTALKALLLSREHPFADIKADGPAAIAEALANLHLEETVKLAANALSAKIVGEVMNNGTMASANKPGWWRIAVDDTDTVTDFPVYPGGAKLYGYGLMFVEVIDGAWLQHYYSHHGQNAKRQDWA
ncbi:hypothetical protein WDM02_25420, partial [Citrobacter meridianamericanus]